MDDARECSIAPLSVVNHVWFEEEWKRGWEELLNLVDWFEADDMGQSERVRVVVVVVLTRS